LIPEAVWAGDASFTAMTRTETLPNGKSAVSDKSNFFKLVESLPSSVQFAAVAHSPPLSIKSAEKSEF